MTKIYLADGSSVVTLLDRGEVRTRLDRGLRDRCMVYLSYGEDTNLVNPYCVTRVE